MDKRIGKRKKQTRSAHELDALCLDTLFEQFIRAKLAEGRSKRTIDQYRENYKFLLTYIDSKGIERTVNSLSPVVIRDYIVWMLHEKVRFEGHQFVNEQYKTVGLSPVTVNTRLKTLRVFFGFLHSEDHIEHDPMRLVKNVEENENEIVILKVEELQRLLEIPSQRQFCDFRDYVLMNLLLDSFLRINEALSLKVSDIDLEAGMVLVRGENAKNRKSRTIPIQQSTASLLKELIEENREFNADFVFLSNYGEQMTANHFRHRLKEYATKANLTSKVHPHLFRHTAATMFLENGGDIRHLQMMLGHRDLRMVLRYTHLSKQALKKQHEQYSPIIQILEKKTSRRNMRKNA
ncbi:tyrosine-type recombinase/integrase [Tumebacillus permanentifrigoris]|uniref:Integrase/recombinase XerD n=1 Tax=Tumebacillus permanentifrigoris TaxID=378543 RepID=A0A316DZ38_9BACL|nr:tyrosine-type recombinase/integrase [Tumebacillus permanentifrigoris]PWK15770.1 integrase/recombinase XerD [Tumebacillus permanentifrigoris]